jgi:hypothetical protein
MTGLVFDGIRRAVRQELDDLGLADQAQPFTDKTECTLDAHAGTKFVASEIDESAHSVAARRVLGCRRSSALRKSKHTGADKITKTSCSMLSPKIRGPGKQAHDGITRPGFAFRHPGEVFRGSRLRRSLPSRAALARRR